MNKDEYAVRGWLHGLVEGSCSIDEAEEVINKFIKIAHEKGIAKGRLEMLIGHNSEKCSEKDEDIVSSLNKGIRERIQQQYKKSGLNGQ